MAGLPTKRSKLLQRQIPTLLGILVLVIGLGVGIFFFSDGLGVFAPRAAPETTPKNVKITNVTDTGFSVSFLTDSDTPGYIRYGATPDELSARAGDDRDQLSGSIGEYTLHHISVRELEPDTEYFFSLGTTGSNSYDNNGQAFTVTTAARAGNPPAAKTIYGSVVSATGSPAEGSVVYVTVPGGGELSSLVQSSGSWAIPLSRARDSQTGGFVELSDDTPVEIFVQSIQAQLSSTTTATVGTGQPVATITLGQNTATAIETSDVIEPAEDLTVEDSMFNEEELAEDELSTDTPVSMNPLPSPDTATGGSTLSARLASPSPVAASLTSPIEENVIVDLTTPTEEVITTSQPLIVGQAAPNVVISIEVNSETQITEEIVADEDGNFELDISRFETELEPGDHSVTYSYVDPATGQTVTETKNFTVAAPNGTTAAARTTTNQLAQAQTSPRPFSSSNPVPVGGVTASPSAMATPVSTLSGQVATRSSQPSTASGIPRSGSVSTTLALVVGGLFFLLAGGWSFWASREWQRKRHDVKLSSIPA